MGEVVQLELFIVTAVDPPLRDNRDTMEFPFLSLQKKRTKPITFCKEDVSLSVHAPAEFGIATIWDWDLIIFAASHLSDAIEAGLQPKHDYLMEGLDLVFEKRGLPAIPELLKERRGE